MYVERSSSNVPLRPLSDYPSLHGSWDVVSIVVLAFTPKVLQQRALTSLVVFVLNFTCDRENKGTSPLSVFDHLETKLQAHEVIITLCHPMNDQLYCSSAKDTDFRITHSKIVDLSR